MTSLWPSAVASLDDSLALLDESLQKLQAAKEVDIADIMEQIKNAAEWARNLSALVSSELPGAGWQSRQELDAIIEDQLQKTSETTVAGGIIASDGGASSFDGPYPL